MARTRIISQFVDDGFFKYNGTTDDVDGSVLPGYYVVNINANGIPSDITGPEILGLFVLIYPGQGICNQLLFRYAGRIYIRRRFGSHTNPFTNWCRFDGIEIT